MTNIWRVCLRIASASLLLCTLLTTGTIVLAAPYGQNDTKLLPRSVYGATPPISMMLYSLAPDLLAGWNWPLGYRGGMNLGTPSRYLLPNTHHLPVLGGIDPGDRPDYCKILLANPSIVVLPSYQKMAPGFADRLKKFGAHVITMPKGSESLSMLPASYLFLGNQLGVSARSDILSQYTTNVLNGLQSLSTIVKHKKTVFYALGPRGYHTEACERLNQLIAYAGGENVAMAHGVLFPGFHEISMGAILSWDPDVIIVQSRETYQHILQSPSWSGLRAVKDRQVFLVPQAFGLPPTILNLLGAQWLAHKLYPNEYKISMVEQTQRFFDLFFHVRINRYAAHRILGDELSPNWK